MISANLPTIIPGTAFPQLVLDKLEPSNAEIAASWINHDLARNWLDLGSGRQKLGKRELYLMLISPRVDSRIFREPGKDTPLGLIVLNDIQNEMGSSEAWGLRGNYTDGPPNMSVAAFLLALANGFLEHDRHVIGSWVVDGNHLSIAMHRQLGMEETGRQRSRHVMNGRRYDRLLFDITREEFATRFPDVPSDSGKTFRQLRSNDADETIHV